VNFVQLITMLPPAATSEGRLAELAETTMGEKLE
jgi:hypothetical protein